MEATVTVCNAKEDKRKIQLPKNIRQIGNIQGAVRIYMEDYVYTYLHGYGRAGWVNKGSIFVGTRHQENGQKYLFISGLVHIQDEYFKEGIPQFTDEMWSRVYQDMKCFYDDVEILGWGMDVACAPSKLTGELDQIHRRAFQGQDKFAFMMDLQEKEEAFYIYEKNTLRRRDGYYIYYEKNPQMREYMMQGRSEDEAKPEIDPQRKVVASYRERAVHKGKKNGKGFQMFVYAACLTLLVAVSAMGVNMMSSVGKIHRLEETVSFLEADKTSIESNMPTSDAEAPAVQLPKGSELQQEQSEKAELVEAELTEEEPSDQKKPPLSEEEKIEEDTPEDPELIIEPRTKEAEASIELPKDEPNAQTEPQTKETSAFAEQDYYLVQKGESLLGISQKIYGKDYTKELCALNELEDENKIYAGQKLLLLDK